MSEIIENAEQNNSVALPHYHEINLRNYEKLNSIFDFFCIDFSIQPENKYEDGGKLITKREVECLEYISQGYTMKNAAKNLDISHRIVENHLKNIKDKFGLSAKNELIEIWHEITKKIVSSGG